MIKETDLIECVQHVKTSDRDYAKALNQMLKRMSVEELAKRIDKSVQWINNKLRKPMELFWQWNEGKQEWELRTPPTALVLKLRYSEHDMWHVYCLGETHDFKSENADSAKRESILWMVSVVNKLNDSLARLLAR